MSPAPSTVEVALVAVRDGYRAMLAGVTALGGRVFWLQTPEQPTIPCVVLQSQDGGGAEQPAIGSVSWSGDIAVRVFATTRDEADALGLAIYGAIRETYVVTSGAGAGVALTSRLRRPLVAPPAKTTHVAGFVYRVIAS